MDTNLSTRSSETSLRELKLAIESGEPAAWLDVEVTPAMAEFMLRYNKPDDTNRRLSPVYVKQQADLIRAGHWVNTGEPIIFSDEAILNDGQHRLESVVTSGLPIVIDIRFGVARRAFINTNSGKKRTISEVLHIAGHSSDPMAGAVVRLSEAYRRGLPQNAKLKVSNGEVVEMYELDERYQRASRLASGLPRYVKNAALGTTIYFALCTGNRATVESFVEVLRFGEGARANPPHRLREAALARAAQYSTEDRITLFGMGLQAWNAYHAGEAIGRWWKGGSGEPFPTVEGYKL